MSAAFTPGPWVAERTVVRNAEGQHRFSCGLTRTAWASQEEMVANARLIAAAPELYAALERLALRCDTATLEDGSSIDTLEAHAILAKARGETLFEEQEQ